MLIQFNKKKNLYDELDERLYGNVQSFSVIYNFIPIEISKQKFILTSLKELEGYLVDYRNGIKVQIHLSENLVEEVNIDSVISFTEKEFNVNCLYDCYIDSICNLLLIRYDSKNLNYIIVDGEINISNDLMFSNEFVKLNYQWFNQEFKLIDLNKDAEVELTWNKKFINLPEIPYIIDKSKNINNKNIPITGSPVFSNKKFIGMVSYLSDEQIIITPLISIKKLSKYLLAEKILYLGIDIFPVGLNFKSELNKIDYSNGIVIQNNYYDVSNLKKNITHQKIKNKKNVISELSNEFESYYNEYDLSDKLNTSEKSEKTETSEKTNKYFMNDILYFTENYKYLKQKNIICSVDNFKIDEYGDIILESKFYNDNQIYKSIPFKSYIWLFKCQNNNNLNLKIIPNHIYKINFINNFEKINITDINLKKKINIIDSDIKLMSSLEDISVFTTSELKYIKYKNNLIIELNEYFMNFIRQLVFENRNMYLSIFEKIHNQRYTVLNKKIIISMNLNINPPNIKIINGIINFDYLIKKYKTKKELRRFIISNC
jgi:hypothetical protein